MPVDDTSTGSSWFRSRHAARSGTVRSVVTELVAVLLLDAVLGAGCFFGAVRQPGPARTAATVATALLAVGWLVLAGVLFAEAGSAENAGTFGASAIGLVGSIILLAGLGTAGLAVVIQRGGDGGRSFVAVVLGVISIGAARWQFSGLETGAETDVAFVVVIALVGLVAVAGAALLVGASEEVARWAERHGR